MEWLPNFPLLFFVVMTSMMSSIPITLYGNHWDVDFTRHKFTIFLQITLSFIFSDLFIITFFIIDLFIITITTINIFA